MATLTKNWRQQTAQRGPKAFPVKSLGEGVEVLVRPTNANRKGEIEDRFPADAETGRAPHNQVAAAMIADCVIDDQGQPVWTEAEVAELDYQVFNELAGIVRRYVLGDESPN